MPTTTVNSTTYEDSDGNERTQYRTSVPKGVAEAMKWDGAEIEWEVTSSNAVTLREVDD